MLFHITANDQTKRDSERPPQNQKRQNGAPHEREEQDNSKYKASLPFTLKDTEEEVARVKRNRSPTDTPRAPKRR